MASGPKIPPAGGRFLAENASLRAACIWALLGSIRRPEEILRQRRRYQEDRNIFGERGKDIRREKVLFKKKSYFRKRKKHWD
jgi:hypothetical protein